MQIGKGLNVLENVWKIIAEVLTLGACYLFLDISLNPLWRARWFALNMVWKKIMRGNSLVDKLYLPRWLRSFIFSLCIGLFALGYMDFNVDKYLRYVNSPIFLELFPDKKLGELAWSLKFYIFHINRFSIFSQNQLIQNPKISHKTGY